MFSLLAQDIRAIRTRDPALRSTFEALTCYPGLHALWFHRVAHALWGVGLHWLARWISHWGRWFTGIEIHPGARIGRGVFIDHGMGIVIGETAEIGDDCTLYQGVTLGGTSWNPGKRHPTLGKGVVVGSGAKILGPFTVGEGARTGSNSVVVNEVPAGATVVGIPGRIVVARTQPSASQTALAEKLGFDAYGLSKDMPDPVAEAMGKLLDHVQALDAKLTAMGIEKPEECLKSEEVNIGYNP